LKRKRKREEKLKVESGNGEKIEDMETEEAR
jgi:hypothetical protein